MMIKDTCWGWKYVGWAVILCWLCTCLPTYGRTFYVNIKSGNDNNSGRSPRYAWQTLRQVNITTFEPGDTILFRAGQEWLGMLFPRGSGTAEMPIVISKYGGVEKPKIHGGHADPVEFDGYSTIQTVLLYNQQHWVISNLEVTNMPDNIMEDFDDNGYERRRGICVVASDTGELKDITIRNNYVHHVKGSDTKDFRGSAGILIAVVGKETPSFFNGVNIIDNRIYMVNRTGIGVSSYWQRRPRDSFYPYAWMDKMGKYQANLNVVIRGNELENIGGDGIVPQTSFKALMEFNKVNGAAARSEGYNAGLWAWNSDSVLIQYNEVWNTHTTRDGMAFDCDAYSLGHIYQYNYSHDNEGGFILFHGRSEDVPDAENVGHIIRHNISVNDGNALVQLYGSGHTRSIVHNNLFYNTHEKIPAVRVEGRPKDIRIHNNVFYMTDMDGWCGKPPIVNVNFTNNKIYTIGQNDAKQKGSGGIKKPAVEDLHTLLHHKENEDISRIVVTPEHILELWRSVLQKSKADIPPSSMSRAH